MSVVKEASSRNSEEGKSSLGNRRLSSGQIAAVVQERKISLHMDPKKQSQINFGICFDIDGVLARGSVADHGSSDWN